MRIKICPRCRIREKSPKRGYCKECRREYDKKRNQKSEIKKRVKEHNQKSEIKKRIKEYSKEYRQQPKSKKRAKEYNKEYLQKPENKKKRKRYLKKRYHKPEIKKKVKEYNQKPENKEKRRERYQEIVKKENKKRKLLGLPLVGEGYKAEMKLLVYVYNLFQNYNILTHDRKTLVNWRPKGLELDIYIPKLKLAFEYMGEQHYKFNHFFYNNNKEKFEAQKYRDRCKKALCKLKGIKLIKIKYDEKLSEQLILSKLRLVQKLTQI